MTSRQRFRETMLFGTPDRIPYYALHYRGATVRKWIEQGLLELLSEEFHTYQLDATAAFVEPVLHQELIRFFGIDRCVNLPVDLSSPIPPFEVQALHEDEEKRIWVDTRGVRRVDFKRTAEPGFEPRAYLGFPVRDRKGFRDMRRRFDPLSEGRYPRNWADQRERLNARTHLVRFQIPGFFWQLREWMGFENACTAFYDDPSLVREAMEFWADYIKAATARALCDVQPDYVVFNEDMAFKTGPMVSPAMFRQFIAPYCRRLVEHFRASGAEVILVDSDGNVNELIPLWIELGINGTFPLEIAAGNDPVAIRKKYGRSCAMIGGIDKREIAKSIRDVDREVDSKVPSLIESGGYVPTIDHCIPPDIPLANYIHLRQRIRSYAEHR